MPACVLAWDLETIPDLDGFAAANGMTGKSSDEIRVAIGDRFPKHIYHSIICLGALIADEGPTGWTVRACGVPHVGMRSERELIRSFVERIADLNPQLVTYNGSAFDLPVLRYRAMIHKISAAGMAARNYFNRYTEDAVDLCDVLSSFGAGNKVTLNELSLIMGLAGKHDGIDGTQIESLYYARRIEEIANYCQADVVNTYRIWLRFELFRGRLTEAQFQASEQNLIDYLQRTDGTISANPDDHATQ